VLSRVELKQYCICTPKSRLEKRLVITVVILVVVIILLLVTVIVLAVRSVDGQELQRFVAALAPKF
jgi:hypothetical protein